MGAFARSREPDRAYGLFMAMQFTLSAAGLYGLPFLLPLAGIEGLFVGFTLLNLLAFRLVGKLPDSKDRLANAIPETIEWRILLSRMSLLCLLGICLFEAATMAHFTYAERIGLTTGLSHGQIGEILAFATILGIPAALAVVVLGDRWGYFLPVLLGASCQIIAVLMLTLGSNPMIYILAMCMLATGWAFSLPYFQAIEAVIDPGGSVVVAGGFATAFGGFIGPAVAATLVRPGIYSAMLLTAAVIYLLVILLMRFVCSFLGRGSTPTSSLNH